MNFAPVKRLVVSWQPKLGQRVVVGRLMRHGEDVLFEYEPSFLTSGLELCPFTLPLRAGVFRASPSRFDGLHGLFDDSLPDGWGRLLLDRRARQLGLSREQLGPLDRLALLGTRAMGALVYEPEQPLRHSTALTLAAIAAESQRVFAGAKADFEQLFVMGGSPHGARPKALVQLDAKGRLVTNDTAAHWLVKFRAKDDPPGSAALEHAYCLMAKAAGIDVPQTMVLGRGRYFAIRRFDRDGTRRLHLLTLAALLDVPHTTPALGADDLLLATRRLVRSELAVEQMFRRVCFNVLAHNRDDHSKNFSFVMDEQGHWQVSPAYDLTFSNGPGGEHWLLISGEGAHPTRAHLEALGKKADLKRRSQLIDEVANAVSGFSAYAREASVSATLKRAVANELRRLINGRASTGRGRRAVSR